ncbi:MAG TPA: hypothetical protein VNM43_10625 [Dehalococcoidia bacterium]|nr:hypothetical protein [Dehalococcoidia bacterium]
MDTDFRIDIAEVNRNIDSAEIIALYFPLLRKTLLMDTRTNDLDGPMIRVVPMASSPEERFKSLMRMRPRFPRPESIVLIPWPKYVRSLVELEVWDHVVRRFAEFGNPAIVRKAEACLRDLYRTEREEILRAIRGERYQTLAGKPGPDEEPADDDEDLDDLFDDDDDEDIEGLLDDEN